MGPPEVADNGAEDEKERCVDQETGEVGVEGEVVALFDGGRVSQERVRRQEARRREKDWLEIGSCVVV
jgi:hypothetical protein